MNFYTVRFLKKTADGGLYPLNHTEQVYAKATDEAVIKGFRQVPLDVLRRGVVSARAYRDMRRVK